MASRAWQAAFLLLMIAIRADSLFFGGGCGSTCSCPQPQCPQVQKCVAHPPCPALFPPPPPPPPVPSCQSTCFPAYQISNSVPAPSLPEPYSFFEAPPIGKPAVTVVPLPAAPGPKPLELTLPPMVALPTPEYAQALPSPLSPPPSLISLNEAGRAVETNEVAPESPFQSAYVEETAPTLLPPTTQESLGLHSSATDYTEMMHSGTARPRPVSTITPDEEDDRIYAKDGEVKGSHSPRSVSADESESLDDMGSSETSARQHASSTVQRTTTTCNSDKLARVMAEAITPDVSVAKKAVQRATELAFSGSKFDVFCANGEFSYSIHSRKYCEATRGEVTCFAFR
ncbi:unnamed protein product, partial [Mesorhabditis spiculigera]